MSQSFEIVLTALRAAAEPTRLRLLVLLSKAELTVGEICEVLSQSQPRVSRHLKLLLEAGLLDRLREQLFVYYRTPVDGAGRELLDRLLGAIQTDDPVLMRDEQRLTRVIEQRRVSASVGTASSPDDAAAELGALLHSEVGDRAIGRLLDVGTGAGHLLKLFASRATRAVGIDISSDALRVARSNLHGAGLSHCEFQRGDMYDLPFAAGAFDTITMDRVLGNAREPRAALIEVARTLAPGGSLVLIDDFDVLSDAMNGNPLTTLREWLAEMGLTCERIRPTDTHDAHLLIAIARRPQLDHRAAA